MRMFIISFEERSSLGWTLWMDNKVIRKVRQTQHQNPELDHHRVRFYKKNLKKNTLESKRGETQKTINFEFCPVSPFS